MKRKLLSVILLALCLCISVVFTACGGDTDGAEGNVNESNSSSDKGGATTESTNKGNTIASSGNEDSTTSSKDDAATGGSTAASDKIDDETKDSGADDKQENEDSSGGNTDKEEEKPLYTREGNKVYFGSYPQTRVDDDDLSIMLTERVGELPTSDNSQAWTSYGYYESGEIKSFMWYVDVEENGEKYRGVYFTSYRNADPTIASSAERSWQDDNGYKVNTIYWFKYEPVSWTILKESDGTALLICDVILDSQPFDSGKDSSNNYKDSTIRAWLNSSFYNTAFTDLQKEIVLTSKVDNSAASTCYNVSKYACANTSDKIYLLSRKEFRTYLTAADQKYRSVTDYALSQGADAFHTTTNSVDPEKGNWWLRSPANQDAYYSLYIMRSGTEDSNYELTYRTCCGVVPVLQITLNK